MTWQPIPVVGGSAADETRLATPQETINWYPVRMERSGGRSDFILRSPSGMTHFTTVGTGPIRGDRDVEGTHFVVSGTRLYRVSHGGAVTELGVIPGEGMVSLTHNQEGGGYTVAAFNGPQGFTYNTITGVFAEITDPGFPGFRVGGFIDSYIAGIEKDGLFAAHSDLANASEYNTVDRYEAEAAPDLLVGQIIDHGEWWLMGRRTIEVYGNTGATTGTFQRIPGSTIERGLAAPFAVAKLDNSVFLLGDDGIAYRANGYNLVRISTQQEEQQFSRCDLSQAFAFTYEDRGHKVFYLTFPDGYTHGYDVASGEWHKRKSYGLENWRIATLTRVGDRWIAGDRFNGNLYFLEWDVMQDDDGPLVSERITGVLHQNGDKLVLDGLMLVFDTGRPQVNHGPGPTITGDAPSSVVGYDYSFAYTLGSGTPPYTVILKSGELPTGVTLSSAGVLSGVSSLEGDYSWTVRVTDSNGLWDELDDGATITSITPVLATDVRHYVGLRDHLLVNDTDIGFPSDYDLVAISPDGNYLVGARNNSASGFAWYRFDPVTSLWAALTAPALNTALISSMSWSPDGDYLAVGRLSNGSDKLTVYKRTGDTLADITSPTGLGTGQINHVAWNADGTRLYVARGVSTQQSAYANFDPTTDTFSAAVIVGQAGLGSGIFVQPNADDSMLVGTGSNGYVYVWDITSTPALKASLLITDAFAAHWDASYSHLIVLNDSVSGPWVRLYEYDSTPGLEAIVLTAAVISQPADNPPQLSTGSAITVDHQRLAIAVTGENAPTIYDTSVVGAVTKLPAIDSTGGTVLAVGWAEGLA